MTEATSDHSPVEESFPCRNSINLICNCLPATLLAKSQLNCSQAETHLSRSDQKKSIRIHSLSSLFSLSRSTMDHYASRNTHSAHTNADGATFKTVNNDSATRTMKSVQVKLSPLHLPSIAITSTPPPSAKSNSPTGVVAVRPRPKALASWVSLNIDSTEDLPPARKLSLGRYFYTNDEEHDDFVLVPPQQANTASFSMSTTASRKASHTHDRLPASQEDACNQVTRTTHSSTRPVILQRREKSLLNPFENDHYRQSRRVVDHNDTVSSTPPARAMPALSSPPSCRNENSMEGFDAPERLLLPSV